MKLYFVRHGETRENVENIIQGHQAGTLTDLGHKQARRLAERLSEIDFTAIYASDLGRVLDTARYVGAFQSAPIQLDCAPYPTKTPKSFPRSAPWAFVPM